MASGPPKTPEAAIQEGRDHYAAKRLRPALESFTRAMKLCPCARGMKRERCICKNFEKVSSESGSIFNEAMYTCSCPVGKTFNKCDNELHMQALDYRAATFEAMQELDRAQRDAEWILELAPRLPDGYLRLGKIARLQKKPEFAWRVYNAGIEAGNDNRLAGSTKLQKLYAARQPLQVRFYRKDPLNNPREIVQRIFSHFDCETITRFLRVSKAWHRYFTSSGNEPIWRNLAFTKATPYRTPPSLGLLQKLIAYSGNDVRSIVIENIQGFRLNSPKFNALLQASQKLGVLSLKGSLKEAIGLPDRPDILKNLTHLTLHGIAIQQPEFIQVLTRNSAQTLEYLDIKGLPHSEDLALDTAILPVLPRLKYLRLGDQDRAEDASVNLNTLVEKTPALEQIWLSDVTMMVSGPPLEESNFWEKLKVVIVSGSDDSDPISVGIAQWIASLRNGTGLHHVDFDFRWRHEGQGAMGLQMISHALNEEHAFIADTSFQMNNYASLRTLRLSRAFVEPLKLEHILTPSVKNNKLHTFDIIFPLDPYRAPEGRASCNHIRSHAWLRGAPSIKCLGIFSFRFRKYPRDDDDLPLPSFLASFPNLETLEINTGHYEAEEFYVVLEAIIRVTNLKRIYQMTAKGAVLDKLRELAEKEGIELIWGERPREWPVPIKD